MNASRSIMLTVAPIVLAGCSYTVRQSFTDEAINRAAFELQCPKEKLEFTGLNRKLEDDARGGTQVGVTGCGKRAVYVLTPYGGWVANTASVDAPTGGESPPKK